MFVRMSVSREPTISDSGISFRRLIPEIPEIPGVGTQEQFNLRSRGGMGHLESYYFLPKATAEKVGPKHVRHIDPEVGVWHKLKITMQGRTITTELDGNVLLRIFKYHDWMLNLEPAPIRLQKHIVVHGDNLGAENPCPIEYRNVFVKELGPNETAPAPPIANRRIPHWRSCWRRSTIVICPRTTTRPIISRTSTGSWTTCPKQNGPEFRNRGRRRCGSIPICPTVASRS